MRLSVRRSVQGVTLLAFPMFLWTVLYQTLLQSIAVQDVQAVGQPSPCQGSAADCAFYSNFHQFKLQQTQSKPYSEEPIVGDKQQQQLEISLELEKFTNSRDSKVLNQRIDNYNTKPKNKLNLYQQRNNRTTDLRDVFLAVKTTHKYHEVRLRWIIDTWFTLAPEQVGSSH